MIIISSRSFISPIARQYFAKVNALGGDVQDKKAINDFTIGLSRIVDPNLWVCWPLRSSQSIGSGTIVPSLGLLGNFPGTLVNGPTWGSDWMSFVPAGSYMTANLPTSFNAISVICVANLTTADVTRGVFGFGMLPTSNTNHTDFATTVANNTHLSYGNGTSFLNVSPKFGTGPRFFGLTTNGSGGNIIAYQDASQLSSSSQGAANPTLANFTIGKRFYDNSHSTNVQESFVLTMNGVLTPTQYLQIRDLYKNTLGTGLSLP